MSSACCDELRPLVPTTETVACLTDRSTFVTGQLQVRGLGWRVVRGWDAVIPFAMLTIIFLLKMLYYQS